MSSIIQGQSCDSCNTKLHLHCAVRFFQNKENPRCPNGECGVIWPHEIPNRTTGNAGYLTKHSDIKYASSGTSI